MQEKISWAMLQANIADFHTNISAFTAELEIIDMVKGLRIDHAGIRVAEKNDVDTVRNELSQYGHCISSEIVNGREILLFELHEPLDFDPWKIQCIELPYPKVNHDYQDGWEHIEFVIPSKALTLDDMKKSFISQFPLLNIEYLQSKYKYSEDMPMAESDQLPNPTIAIRKDKNTCIKFHPKPIQTVIGYVR